MTSSSESDYSSKKSRSHHRTRTRRVDSDRDDGRRRKREIKEEDIIEYMAKKAQKKAMKNAKKLKSQPISGYSNDSNPFGDSNLNEQFLWRKKLERDISQGQVPDMSTKAEKKRHRERMAEIEKVKKRREERAIERLNGRKNRKRFGNLAMLARERARAEFQDWEKKEEEFHFDQSKIRSEIRLREGRTKPIDVLSKNLNGSEEFDIEIDEPYNVFKLAEARKRDACDRARVRGEEPPAEVLAEERGLHSSIEADVRDLLQGKTSSELEILQHQIESQMRSGTAKVVEYWEAVLKRLQIYKAKARLREIHADLLRRHLKRLEHPVENTDNIESDDIPMLNEDDTVLDVEAARAYSPAPVNIEEQEELEEEPGSFSPELFHGDEDGEAIDPEEDKIELPHDMQERKRMAVLEEQQKRIREAMARKPIPSEDSLEMKAMKAMGVMEEGDAVFGSGAEVNLDSQVYWWHDKYRPRKPKYFNRVHTGYEWNKYNQTHYDHDNPPPKIVQGYKFNIFYPDLVDKTKAPVYTIEKDGSSGETCFIRFHAGPPYEDIAFRIVNKEWEYSHKKGFKCTFERASDPFPAEPIHRLSAEEGPVSLAEACAFVEKASRPGKNKVA
ncbi:hypothetical protein QJS10_CPA02g00431 [Acorus calamus]|uniref:Splicing factor Cactin n=1 Tax=Acorus calamus TaxID=4465 RepID=A0AAV9FDF9_ACOCL|nr:hypothetical protein QJS10_CPA02g00431 [Acorus calamus]